jgi:hypothetical protein
MVFFTLGKYSRRTNERAHSLGKVGCEFFAKSLGDNGPTLTRTTDVIAGVGPDVAKVVTLELHSGALTRPRKGL